MRRRAGDGWMGRMPDTGDTVVVVYIFITIFSIIDEDW